MDIDTCRYNACTLERVVFYMHFRVCVCVVILTFLLLCTQLSIKYLLDPEYIEVKKTPFFPDICLVQIIYVYSSVLNRTMQFIYYRFVVNSVYMFN